MLCSKRHCLNRSSYAIAKVLRVLQITISSNEQCRFLQVVHFHLSQHTTNCTSLVLLQSAQAEALSQLTVRQFLIQQNSIFGSSLKSTTQHFADAPLYKHNGALEVPSCLNLKVSRVFPNAEELKQYQWDFYTKYL